MNMQRRMQLGEKFICLGKETLHKISDMHKKESL